LALATPAQALPTPVTESFEGGLPRSQWTTMPAERVVFGFNTLAQSGVAVADMDARGLTTNVRMYRTLAINRVPGSGGSVACSAGVHLRKFDRNAVDSPVSLKVHKAGVDSDLLIPERQVKVDKFSVWTYFQFGRAPVVGVEPPYIQSWAWQEAPFTIEITVNVGRVLVDDLLIGCVRSPR
jgi:hypothetical protein